MYGTSVDLELQGDALSRKRTEQTLKFLMTCTKRQSRFASRTQTKEGIRRNGTHQIKDPVCFILNATEIHLAQKANFLPLPEMRVRRQKQNTENGGNAFYSEMVKDATQMKDEFGISQMKNHAQRT